MTAGTRTKTEGRGRGTCPARRRTVLGHEGPRTPARRRPPALIASLALLLILLVLQAALAGVALAGPASPTPVEDTPAVNWGWLGAGLGGAILLLVLMYLLSRAFARKQRRK